MEINDCYITHIGGHVTEIQLTSADKASLSLVDCFEFIGMDGKNKLP